MISQTLQKNNLSSIDYIVAADVIFNENQLKEFS